MLKDHPYRLGSKACRPIAEYLIELSFASFFSKVAT
jgi:hypothetical protein